MYILQKANITCGWKFAVDEFEEEEKIKIWWFCVFPAVSISFLLLFRKEKVCFLPQYVSSQCLQLPVRATAILGSISKFSCYYDKILWPNQTPSWRYSPSWLGRHGGWRMSTLTRGIWSQEAERLVCWYLTHFLLFIKPTLEWCCLYFRWIFPPHVTATRNSLIGMPRGLSLRWSQVLSSWKLP